jgi:hypothetical protein
MGSFQSLNVIFISDRTKISITDKSETKKGGLVTAQYDSNYSRCVTRNSLTFGIPAVTAGVTARCVLELAAAFRTFAYHR